MDFDLADSAIIGFAAAVVLQTVLLSKAKKRFVKLLPAIISAAAALVSAGAAVFGYMLLERDAAAENAYIPFLAASFFGAALIGCGLAALCGSVMKTRAAVIVPIAAAVISVGAVFAAEWARGAYQHNWDLRVNVDEISASESGDLNLKASDIWGDDLSYSLTVPKKLAEKYNLYEGMVLSCDVEESGGEKIVTNIEKLYKK